MSDKRNAGRGKAKSSVWSVGDDKNTNEKRKKSFGENRPNKTVNKRENTAKPERKPRKLIDTDGFDLPERRPSRPAQRPNNGRSSNTGDRRYPARSEGTDRRTTGDKDRRYPSRSEGTDRDRKYSDRSTSDRRTTGDKDRRYPARSEGTDRDKQYSDRGSYERRSEGDRRYPNTEKRYYEKERSEKKKKYDKPVKNKDTDELRLNKFIANSGICSRREADDYITAGLVSVNGVIVTELGTKVNRSDEVRFNDERLKGEQKVYLLLNKPKDYITTLEDPHAKKTVMELIEGACKERIYPVGRLDRNTTGVLLFTNDGDLTKKLTHPSFEKKKIYHVRLDKNLTKNDMTALLEGITLDDGPTSVDQIDYVDNKSDLGVEIHSGKNRIIRRMFDHLGYKVIKLDRVYFAGLTKKGLQRGHWRMLTPKEVNVLKMGSYE